MIVYGWNSFKLEEYKPSRFGMSAELDEQYTIERRQKYAHLFWIPFFGIGKTWVLRKKQDDQMYEPSAEVRVALESLTLQHKTPWYTFSLFFVLMAGGFMFFIYETTKDYNRERDQEAYQAQKIKNISTAINSPEPGTFFKMKEGEKKIYLKVLYHDNKSLICLVSKKKNDKYSSYEIEEAFIADSTIHSFDTVKVLKQDMLKTINREDVYTFTGHEVIKGAGNYVLDEFKVNALPIFKILGSGYEEGSFFAAIQNIGENGKLKNYDLGQTNLDLGSSPFPSEFRNGEVFILKGSYKEDEPKASGKISFESLSHEVVEYDLYIRGAYLSMKHD